MFTILADAMFTATLKNRGNDFPDRLKDHSDRYLPKHDRRVRPRAHPHNLYRDLW